MSHVIMTTTHVDALRHRPTSRYEEPSRDDAANEDTTVLRTGSRIGSQVSSHPSRVAPLQHVDAAQPVGRRRLSRRRGTITNLPSDACQAKAAKLLARKQSFKRMQEALDRRRRSLAAGGDEAARAEMEAAAEADRQRRRKKKKKGKQKRPKRKRKKKKKKKGNENINKTRRVGKDLWYVGARNIILQRRAAANLQNLRAQKIEGARGRAADLIERIAANDDTLTDANLANCHLTARHDSAEHYFRLNALHYTASTIHPGPYRCVALLSHLYDTGRHCADARGRAENQYAPAKA